MSPKEFNRFLVIFLLGIFILAIISLFSVWLGVFGAVVGAYYLGKSR